MSNSRNTRSMRGKTAKRTRSACRQANEMPSEPGTELRRLQTADVNSSRRRVATRRPLRGSTAGEQTAKITKVRGSSVANSSDRDSVKCPVCLVTFTTQQVATPDTCDHTFCTTCLHELSQNENKCPTDKMTFNFILVRHHLGGEIITRIPVEPPRRQDECDCEEDEHLCCDYTSGEGWTPVLVFAYILAKLAVPYVLPAYFSR
jgi:hypothetical protein